MLRSLVVEDDPVSMKSLAQVLEREGFTTRTASTLEAAKIEWAAPDKPALLLCDLMLPDGSGLELIKEIERDPNTEVVLITGHATVDTAVEALRLGVSDYLLKPLDMPRLKAVCANVKRSRELKAEIGRLRTQLRKLGRFEKLVGASPVMERVYDLISKVAPTEATVLLTGESGTGKDLAAETIHSLSRRSKATYLPLNCGAVSPNLIESELFGHEKGSFTGASRQHRGYFERTSGGTLFLDEITEMPIELQVKLLRVLETGTVIRIGGDQPVAVDVRVIAASNRKLEEAVSEGRLREDLLYRLKVFPIDIPPLRDRGSDIDLLAEHFLLELNNAEQAEKRLTKEALKVLAACQWPGNVRELKNVIHRAFILADQEIGPECLACGPGPVAGEGAEASALSFRLGTSLSEVERRVILATLDHCGGDKRRAADALGLSLRTLYYRLNSYNVPSPAPGEGPLS